MLRENIKKIRKNKNITIQELSNLSGISIASLSMYESGKRVPSIKNIKKIAYGLGVEVATFYEDNLDNLNSEDADKEIICIQKIKESDNEAALKRADGRCELCQSFAPFLTNDGIPYLVTKEIYYDAICRSYTFALCPNCCAKMTILNLEGDKKFLFERYIRRLYE